LFVTRLRSLKFNQFTPTLLEKKSWKNSLGNFFSLCDENFHQIQLNLAFPIHGEFFFSHIERCLFPLIVSKFFVTLSKIFPLNSRFRLKIKGSSDRFSPGTLTQTREKIFSPIFIIFGQVMRKTYTSDLYFDNFFQSNQFA